MYYRIDLEKTNYKEIEYKILNESSYENLVEIYKKYLIYKNFEGALPIYLEDVQQSNSEIIGYFDKQELVAFSLILLYPSRKSVTADQFAWDYKNPKLKLGYKSIRSECARYKRLGFKYFHLGDYYNYKADLKGFEIAKSTDV